MASKNSYGAAAALRVNETDYQIFRLDSLEKAGLGKLARIPYAIKVLLENLLRFEDERTVKRTDIEMVAKWDAKTTPHEINFRPARILLQDFTGVPCVVDLASMRDALKRLGANPQLANPLIPADLVIDHSVQVDAFGSAAAFQQNALLEFSRNQERYAFLRWGQKAFQNFRVVPPDTGIVHQVNLEYLASVVFSGTVNGTLQAYPDTLMGTDSHTTMVNGLGVVGWGVGGIEAEACMLGQPISMLLPQVVGFKITGKLAEGATATDLVLTVTQMLRKKGVVGKFVEFYGSGVSALSLADRATISNMAPEYGATIGFFPIDGVTLDYLKLTNRSAEQINLIEAYAKEQSLFLTPDSDEAVYSDTLSLDLSKVVPSMAGPRRPQDRIDLPSVKENFLASLEHSPKSASVSVNGHKEKIHDGAVVIAAITSCTNTSNPSVMIAAGLLAKKAVEKGLTAKPWVKTSLAPGSKVVLDYLTDSGLMPYLEKLNFHLVGYGCTTCIGNSGPLPENVATAVLENKLNVAAVLSGNRNFEGRVNPLVRSNYLASPPLVVAYAIAGRVDIDITKEPLGKDTHGKKVYLRDIWPSPVEVEDAVKHSARTEFFRKEYSEVFEGDANWNSIRVPTGNIYEWSGDSTYIKQPPYFESLADPLTSVRDMTGLRVLAILGDSVTTDHISPAGSIPVDSPAGKYLVSLGVKAADFNSYGARRGNHEVMVRGTFGNIRLKNQMVPGVEGSWTRHMPDGEKMFIYDAAMKYKAESVPLLVIAGKEYGSGSSRDWAAKGTLLLGIRAVIAESFERIHRSNLVQMGVLPLQFLEGANRESLGLTGEETYELRGVPNALSSGKQVEVIAEKPNGKTVRFEVRARLDTLQEFEYYRNGGILPYVLRQLMAGGSSPAS
ncbi:MAG: aconitate hydratase AcnA [Acidobacteriaceae bacterium]|nr:aconitate hydratase AcnA [Acidobacteriaceae bacterium]MBV9781076.1 aconitate hydratase AcnA [Acidobacteriaceae bacterium]